MATSTGTAQGGGPVLVITHRRKHLTDDFQVFHNNEPTHASPLTPSLTDNYPVRMVSCVQASASDGQGESN